ncbi:glycosyltransferase family 2 protein [Vibrio splendidus]
MSFQILLSTMNDRIFDIDFNSKYSYVVVHQISNNKEADYEKYLNENLKCFDIEYVQSNILGLSASRNIAMETSSANIVWLMDDDTKILDGIDEQIKNYISASTSFVVLNYWLGDVLKAHGNSGSLINILNCAKISSISMCFSRVIIDQGIRFRTNFGLGSAYPSGEEYIFMADMLKHGYKGVFSDLVGCYHPPITSGMDFYSSKRKIFAKLHMFRQVFPRFYSLFILLFFVKKFPVLWKKERVAFYIRSALLFFALEK